jgi:hypothetical protein
MVMPVATAESRRLSEAFVASAQLRPMAQQLVLSRSAAAYSGVVAYAAGHPGEAAATANLALGHAYMLDRRYPMRRLRSARWMRAARRWRTTPSIWARRPR